MVSSCLDIHFHQALIIHCEYYLTILFVLEHPLHFHNCLWNIKICNCARGLYITIHVGIDEHNRTAVVTILTMNFCLMWTRLTKLKWNIANFRWTVFTHTPTNPMQDLDFFKYTSPSGLVLQVFKKTWEKKLPFYTYISSHL